MKRFTSIRHPIALDAGLGRLAIEPDYAKHVEQLMLQVLLTNPGERVNRPTFGSNLMQLVFAPASDELATVTEFLVQGALQQWVGDLIQVDSLEVVSEDATLRVELQYVVRRTGEVRTTAVGGGP